MKKRILFTAAALVCAANLTAQCLGVGSSTSSMSPEEMAAAAKAGVEYVEIGISGRGTVAEIREKALHAKRMADEAGLKVWSCHLPFSRKLDISVLNDSARMANLEFLTEMIAICGEVGPEKLVLHPSSEPIADGEREQRIRNSIASIGILRREAARIGAQLCIEDLPRTCLGRNSAELLRIIAPYPEVKICFDTNHLLSEDLLHFVEACGDRIATVHVSDYDMVDERHWLPGQYPSFIVNNFSTFLSEVFYRIILYKITVILIFQKTYPHALPSPGHLLVSIPGRPLLHLFFGIFTQRGQRSS